MTLPHGFMGSHLSCCRALELSVGAEEVQLIDVAGNSMIEVVTRYHLR